MIRIEWPGVMQNLFNRRVWLAPMPETVSSTGGFWKGFIFGLSSLEPEESEEPDLGFLARVGE